MAQGFLPNVMAGANGPARFVRTRVFDLAKGGAARPVCRGDRRHHARGGAGGGDRAALPKWEPGPCADRTGAHAADVRGAAVLRPVGLRGRRCGVW